MSRGTTVTSYRLRRFATILLVTVALIFVTTAASNAVAQCQTSGRSCGGNSASNDGRCCAGLVCGTTGCCTAGCRINNTLYGSGATNPRNPCQSCQPSVSTTSWTNKSPGTTCNDNNACTTQDKCQAGTCAGTALSCDDHNSCTQDSCDPARGCVRQNLTGSCDDGNACTLGDTCSYGTCRAGTGRLTCNDYNACTNDSCDPSRGCVYTNNTNSCSDGNACTVGDKCGGGSCRPGTGTQNCNDSNGCTDDWCDPTLGCKHSNNTSSCSDGNPCTVGDACSGGYCRPGGPNSCDDNNPCTNDTCDRYYSGGCKHTNNSNSCDDHNACTSGDKCSNGVCKAGTGTVTCNDNNPCTDDSCSPSGGCVSTNNSRSCDDHNTCTSGDTCSGGTCRGTPRVCNDNNPCTDDSCNPSSGACVSTNNDRPCDDHNACTTGDACSGGTCHQGTSSLPCDDQNPCTDDTCDPATGCVYTPDDTNSCATLPCVTDACVNGHCISTPITCDDDNSCTLDSCDLTSGQCVHTPVDCDDNNACTLDSCDVTSGLCVHDGCADNNPCTDDTCDPATGCVYTPNDGNSCFDETACTSDACVNGRCVSTTITCDDQLPCTDNMCDPATGCFYPPAASGTPCSDNDACTDVDQCSGGECLPGDPVLCDDHNSCTFDFCNPSTGCVYSPVEHGTPCDGGDICAGFNFCSDGACVPPESVPPCDDRNTCTTDTCVPPDGCVFTANSDPCSDGNPCTAGDVCSQGLCEPGPDATNCDDGNDCTGDTCDPLTGCQHTALDCSFRSKSARVVVFDDERWVTESSARVQTSLTTLLHSVTTFTGIDADSINAALVGKQVLLIPEQKKVAYEDELHRRLEGPAIAAFQNFVACGGGLIIHGSIFDLDQAFLQTVFGIYVAGGGECDNGLWFMNPDTAAAAIPEHSVVTLLPYGAGEIVVLGWDRDDAPAILPGDDRWQQVLDRAVNEVAKLTTFTASPGAPIPDDGYTGGFNVAGQTCSVIDTNSLPAGSTVHHVDLDIDITHTWVGDLVIKLQSPDGSILGIVSRPGSPEPADDGGTGGPGEDSNWGGGLRFSDTGPASAEQMGQKLVDLAADDVICTDGGTPCHYTPAPDSIAAAPMTFADFNGENARGNWTLCVGDARALDTGTLNSWSLTVH